MRQIFLLLLLNIFSTTAALAHLNGSIAGTVVDQASGQPLQGAKVQLLKPARTVYTNDLGKYRFESLAVGTYTLKISLIGFITKEVELTVKDDETTTLQTKLLASSVELSEVTVSTQPTQEQQLIGNLDIKLRPINNSQEILRLVPGLFIGQHAGGGKAEQIFLRGFDLDHGTDIRLTVDGMPVNMVSHAHGQGYADLHFVIPELVQAVDFGKGPYNTTQGNLATAGYVNLKTRTVLDSSMVKLEAGQFDTYRAVGLFDLLNQQEKNQQQSAYIASEYYFSNGYFENPQDFKRLNLLGKYHGHLTPSTRLTLTASTFYSR